MTKRITLKKGVDINIAGAIVQPNENVAPTEIRGKSFAMIPDDFIGLTPKLDVKEGDNVLAGTPLFHDKTNPDICVVSPIGGTIDKIERGDRRKLLQVIITPDYDKSEAVKHDIPSDTDGIRRLLQRSGLWAMMRQRPYDIIPSDATPRDIFVTAFDSAPLAPDLSLSVGGDTKAIQAGVDALKTLTTGNVYIGVKSAFADISNAEIVEFNGSHPAGLPGIQAANIAPVNKGETIWTLDIVTLWRIGRLMIDGVVPMSTIVAVTGSEIEQPKYASTIIGADIASVLDGNIKSAGLNRRIISGNVLCGIKESINGHLHAPYRHITVIPEGDDVDEMMGWASLSPKKMSISRSFPGHFLRKRLFSPDARLLGGRRAMIMSGEYERVLPMDIMAEYLLKAIISRDIDKMEALGIYEIAPEDMALCEYVDTSKLEIQRIVREGLDFLYHELN